MIRDRLSVILNTKAFYIVLSIVAAIALWTYVTYVENPDKTVTVSDIPVVFSGSEDLQEANLVVTNIDKESLTLDFIGKLNVVTKLTNANIILTVDLADIISTYRGTTGVYLLPYDVEYPSGINNSSISIDGTDYISVTVEKLVKKVVPVTGVNNSTVVDGYQVQPMIFEPESITVFGSEAMVSKISSASVTIDKENISKTVTEDCRFTLLDDNNNVVEMDKGLTTSHDTIAVTLPVLMVKDIALTVNLTYSNTALEENTVCRVLPDSITLAGDPDILKDINQIVLGTIDLTDFSSTMSEDMLIPIPNEITNLTGDTTARVSVEVIGMTTKRLSASNIQVKNETSGSTTSIITQSLDITLRGSREDINAVTSSNIRIVADLAELGTTAGTFSVPAKVYIDGFVNIDAIGDYKISVVIS